MVLADIGIQHGGGDCLECELFLCDRMDRIVGFDNAESHSRFFCGFKRFLCPKKLQVVFYQIIPVSSTRMTHCHCLPSVFQHRINHTMMTLANTIANPYLISCFILHTFTSFVEPKPPCRSPSASSSTVTPYGRKIPCAIRSPRLNSIRCFVWSLRRICPSLPA